MVGIHEKRGVFTDFLPDGAVLSGDILVKERIWDVLLDRNSTLVTTSLVTTFSYLYSFFDSLFSDLCTSNFLDSFVGCQVLADLI